MLDCLTNTCITRTLWHPMCERARPLGEPPVYISGVRGARRGGGGLARPGGLDTSVCLTRAHTASASPPQQAMNGQAAWEVRKTRNRKALAVVRSQRRMASGDRADQTHKVRLLHLNQTHYTRPAGIQENRCLRPRAEFGSGSPSGIFRPTVSASDVSPLLPAAPPCRGRLLSSRNPKGTRPAVRRAQTGLAGAASRRCRHLVRPPR